jgi:hypothetical protein
MVSRPDIISPRPQLYLMQPVDFSSARQVLPGLLRGRRRGDNNAQAVRAEIT